MPEDLRDAFFDEVAARGRADDRIVVLANDMDVFGLRRFREECPGRFVNVGVAEQNMMNVAAGLAASGKRPVCYGIASFVTYRCFEQLKFTVCSMGLPVVVAGVGTGYSFSFDGPTHHATFDVALMRTLPELTLYSPGDPVSAAASARAALAADGPSYVRVDRGPRPRLYASDDPGLADGCKVLRPLAATTIVATGLMTHTALAVADRLAAAGLAVGVVDVFRLKPLSPDLVRRLLTPGARLVTLEEHTLTGGLGTMLAEQAADRGWQGRLLRLGSADRQLFAYGSRAGLLGANGLDERAAAAAVAALAEDTDGAGTAAVAYGA